MTEELKFFSLEVKCSTRHNQQIDAKKYMVDAHWLEDSSQKFKVFYIGVKRITFRPKSFKRRDQWTFVIVE